MKKIGIISLVFFVMFALITPTSLAEDGDLNGTESIEIIEGSENQQEGENVIVQDEVVIENNNSQDTEDSVVSPALLTNIMNDSDNDAPAVDTLALGAVAKIDGVEYTDLKAAIDAANDGNVIVLVSDATVFFPIEVTKSITIKSETDTRFTISAGVTFDKSTANQTILTAKTGVTLTLKNISINGAPKYGVQAYDGGTVVVNDVNFSDNLYGGILANGGKVKLEGPFSITGNSAVGIEIAKGNVVVGDPSIELVGDFTTSLPLDKLIYIDKAQVTEMSDALITVGGNYELVKNNNGFVIKKGEEVVASPSLPNGKILVQVDGVTTTGFDTLEEAFELAPEGSVLIIQEDLEVIAPIIVKRNVSIDGNGKNLTATYSSTSGNQSVLTFTNTATVSNLTISNSPKYGIQVFGANAIVTINDVKLDNNAYGGILINGGTAKVSNVEFIGQSTGIEIGKGSDTTSASNLEILGEIKAANAARAIYIDLNQVTNYEQSKITSTFYDVATAENGLITLKKDGNVVFETAGNIKKTNPTTSNSSTSTTTWDDGGPFTTDSCGNIFDRWGNELYKAPYCKVTSGYKVPNTGVK